MTEKALIEYIDQLIRLESTGTPGELSYKLSVSERTVYSLIKRLKEDYGAPIEYCRGKNSYVYRRRGAIKIGFVDDYRI